MPQKKWITFLTDYGLENKFIGVCHGVMARIAPEARVMDVTHLVPRGDIQHGAEIFRQAIPYLPDAVHLTVVDPGVGTQRKPVVLEVGSQLFVGPDNGLLLRAADIAGGVSAAYELADPKFRLDAVSTTFHGRDVFAPAAAHLANGVSPKEFGPSVPVTELVRIPDPVRDRRGDAFLGEVVIKDRFGNLQTSLDSAYLRDGGITMGAKLELTAGGSITTIPFVETFGSVPEGAPLAHIDSADRLALAVNLGDAAKLLSLSEGSTFSLRHC
ncbi:S-adenosyl-l-methionine hydroxide adenosyltransferase family protein [Streptomyces sp. NPDC050161]|uniref:S-adenosyl-l-methionine hydroxide adenosyltransferase family protein n=1 Tax=Streptomyces sp. NPDC050161 TaxID=3365604 RepID=UPI0037B15CF0